MRRAALVSAAILTTVIATSSSAFANGRFPESNQIAFSEVDPDLVLLRVTFGLLLSHDRGKTFSWVCEQSIGYSGVEDPMYTITPSKAYIGSTFQGLSISRDQACGWSFAGGDLASQVFIDLAANPNDGRNVVVFASSYDKQDDAGNILFTSRLWETKDEGQTFQQLGQPLDPGLLGYTVDFTKSDPDRIYVTAVRKPGGLGSQAFLLTSKNHGQTWEETTVPLEGSERALFIAAVDPKDADRVYLRTSNGVDKPSRLLLREADPDSGVASIRKIHTTGGPLTSFALTPEGDKIYIGGPRDPIMVANTTDFVFQTRSTIPTQCLAWSAEGLWACSDEGNGFVAGLSKDDGVTFEPRLRFCDIKGPLECSVGSTTNDRCNPIWTSQKEALGCGGPRPDAGADAGGFTNSGGFQPTPPPSKNCDCHAAPAGPWGAFVSVVGAAVALVRRARRRR